MNITERAAVVLREIDEALVMSERATPGPWARQDIAGASYVSRGNKTTGEGYRLIACVTTQTHYQSDSNGDLIAASRTLLPASLRTLKTAIEVFLAIIDVEADEKGEPEPAGIVASAALTTLCDQWEDAR